MLVTLYRFPCNIFQKTLKQFSTTTINNYNQKWRQNHALPLNPNSEGILTDGPDYSYLDGRPTPYGSHQKRRILEQRHLAAEIIRLSSEIDFAVDNHKKLQQTKEKQRKKILENKLKAKGKQLC